MFVVTNVWGCALVLFASLEVLLLAFIVSGIAQSRMNSQVRMCYLSCRDETGKQGRVRCLAVGKALPPGCSRPDADCFVYLQLPAEASKMRYGCA